jgi:GAF domain-containing protein
MKESNMDSPEPGSGDRKRRIGFVDLPDAAAATLLRYLEDPAWEVEVVVAHDLFSDVGRRTAAAGVPLRDLPTRAALAACDRIVVGDEPPSLLPAIREMLRATAAEVLSLREEEALTARPLRRLDEAPPLSDFEGPAGALETGAGGTGRGEAAPAPDREPEPDPPPFSEEEACFHAATLLGAEVSMSGAGLKLESSDGRFRRAISKARAIAQAKTVSVMLLDTDGRHLRIAAAEGLDAATIEETRRAVGAGLAGRVFATGQPQTQHAEIPPRAEDEASMLSRFAASVPLRSSGQTIGVLSVNTDAADPVSELALVDRLNLAAKEVTGALLGAIDVGRLQEPGHRVALLRQVDRIMSLEETLPTRMSIVAEVLRRCLRADSTQLFLVDPLHRQMIPMGDSGRPSWSARTGTMDLESGFLGWIMTRGRPRLLEVPDEASGERRALIAYPVHATHPHSLFVLENVPIDELSAEEILEVVGEAVVQVEEMIGVEEGVAAQELVSEFEMRIADQSSQLSHLAPDLAIRSLLEFTLDLLAAEAAVWIPRGGGSPIASQPSSLPSARILARAWSRLEEIGRWVRERGIVAGGSHAWGWDDDGPDSPAPYVGACAPDGESILLLFFSDEFGGVAQVPAHVLRRALTRISERIGERLERAEGPLPPTAASWTPPVLGGDPAAASKAARSAA